MGWKKMSPEVAALLEEAVGPYACNKRRMFGHDAYFINNNMWTGVFEDRIFVRLLAADRERLLGSEPEAVQFEPLPGRPMKEYIELPPDIYESAALSGWLNDAYAYASSLPQKTPKRKK